MYLFNKHFLLFPDRLSWKYLLTAQLYNTLQSNVYQQFSHFENSVCHILALQEMVHLIEVKLSLGILNL